MEKECEFIFLLLQKKALLFVIPQIPDNKCEIELIDREIAKSKRQQPQKALKLYKAVMHFVQTFTKQVLR